MGRVEKSIVINAPPEKVWEMLAFDRFPEWDEGTQKNAKSVEYVSEVNTPEDKFKVGAIAHHYGKNGKLLFPIEVTESLENKRFAYHLSGGPVKQCDTLYVLETVENGTKFTSTMDYEMLWGVFGKFLNTLFAQRMLGNEVERSLGQLKSILEK